MGRPRKALISRRRTLEVALRIIDEEGLEAVSIRRLGQELNVQGISLYHHFKDKEEILVGVCRLAFSTVRTPHSADLNWREWLLNSATDYSHTLAAHPNLIPILMGRHPVRIVGLAERNATAGLLAVQGVPPELVMPLIEALEEIALGSACYRSPVNTTKPSEAWKNEYPFLYHFGRQTKLSKERIFVVIARAAIDALIMETKGGADDGASTPNTAPIPKLEAHESGVSRRTGSPRRARGRRAPS
jgi:TetR/AcrR family transcriptional regulator, tetracycline repressor protein